MTVIISSEANAPLPGAGEVTLFVNTDKNGILYAKYPDGSLQPYNGASDANSAEIAKAWMDALACALKNGDIEPNDFESLMNTGITIDAQSTTDADGNTHSILSVGSRILSLISIALDSIDVSLDVSSVTTHQIVTTFNPTNISNNGLIYVSSDITIATVNSTGLISPVAPGVAIISVIPQADPSKAKIVTVTATP